MDVLYYIGFFHDGTLQELSQKDSRIEIILTSYQLESSGNVYNIPLDSKNRLNISVKSIQVNDAMETNLQIFHKKRGEILDFDVEDSRGKLGVEWYHFPSPAMQEYSMIKIEAAKITWKDMISGFREVIIYPPHE